MIFFFFLIISVRSHVNWEGKRVSTRTLALNEMDCEIRLERGTKHFYNDVQL